MAPVNASTHDAITVPTEGGSTKTSSSAPASTKPAPASTKHAEKGASGVGVGARISVWWPDEKQFNAGVVLSFDPVDRTHHVGYDNGTELWHNLTQFRTKLLRSAPTVDRNGNNGNDSDTSVSRPLTPGSKKQFYPPGSQTRSVTDAPDSANRDQKKPVAVAVAAAASAADDPPSSPQENDDDDDDADDDDDDDNDERGSSSSSSRKPTPPTVTTTARAGSASGKEATLNTRVIQSSRVLNMWTAEQDVALHELVKSHQNPWRALSWATITAEFNAKTGMSRSLGSIRIHYERMSKDRLHKASGGAKATGTAGAKQNKMARAAAAAAAAAARAALPAKLADPDALTAGEQAGIRHLATTARAWTEGEIKLYFIALKRHGRDHEKIHATLKDTKTLDQVVNYHSNVNRSYGDFLTFVSRFGGDKKPKKVGPGALTSRCQDSGYSTPNSADPDGGRQLEDDGSPLKRGSVSDEDAGGRAGKRRRFRVQRLVNGATETAGTVPNMHAKLFVPPGTVIQRDSSLVGNRIMVWWPQEKKSYFGDVIDWDAKDQMHEVRYQDGEKLWHDLREFRWKIRNGENAVVEPKEVDYEAKFKPGFLNADVTELPTLMQMDYLQAVFLKHRDAAREVLLGTF